MSNHRSHTPFSQPRLLLVGLLVLTVVLTLAISLQPFAVRALQGDSPLPTDTHTPTFTPVPVDTDTPTPTDTPIPDATATPTFTPIPVDTVTATATDTPVFVDTPTATPTPLPGITPATPTPPLPGATPTATLPPAAEPITATIPLTSTIILTTTGVPPTAPPENSDTLVLLIDTLVLYSAYFFLGCGFIVFIVLVLGFILLHRRAKALQEQNQPPQPPGL